MLTEANLEAHDFRIAFAKELLATMEHRRNKAALVEANETLRAKVANLTAQIEKMQSGVMDMKPIWDNHLVIYGKNYCDEDRKGDCSLHEFLLDFRGELMEYRMEKASLVAKVAALTEENDALKVKVPKEPVKDSMCEYRHMEMKRNASMRRIDAMYAKADRLLAERRTAKRPKVSEGN